MSIFLRFLITALPVTVIVLLQDVDLAEEAHQRPNQVFIKVEIVVCHVGRGQKESWPRAPILQLVCLRNRNKFVFLPVHDEGWARHSVHPTQIVELFSHQEAQEANFVRRHTLYRGVGGHQDEATGFVLCAKMGGRARAERPPKQDDVLLS